MTSKAAAKKRLAVFLVVTFALTWGMQIPLFFALGAFENGELATPAIVLPVAISMFFPLVGALIANLVCKKEDRIDLGLKPHIGANIPSYLAAWFGPAAITLLGCILFFVLNPQLFDPTLESYFDMIRTSAESTVGSSMSNMPTESELANMGPMLIIAAIMSGLTLAPFINMIPAFGEEAGWRGMLFPTLCELMSTRAAVIVSGVIWGLWHAPIIAIGHNYGMGYPGFPITGILVMIVACTALGACLSYLRVRTESVWPCALCHGAVNATANIGVAFCVTGQTLAGPSPLGYIAGIPLLVIGIICWRKIEG